MKVIFLVISILTALSIDSDNSLEFNSILVLLSLGFGTLAAYMAGFVEIKK